MLMGIMASEAQTNVHSNGEQQLEGDQQQQQQPQKETTPPAFLQGDHHQQAVILPPETNSTMPPQQVYVNAQNGITLETQFMSLGLNGDEKGDAQGQQEEAAPNTTTTSTTGDNDAEQDSEDDPVKLFVGQVPKNLSEEDIFPTFSPFGPLKDVTIIRDRNTGLHRGCAFVTFWSSSDAEQAQEALHNKYTFPGGKRAAQVKPAEPATVPENKLFIGMLSRTATEEDVRDLFAPYGEIREIYLIRNSDGSSRCAAFLRYIDRESAIEAIQNLNNSITMEGASRPLIVKFADNKAQRHARYSRHNRRDHMVPMGGGGAPPYAPYQMPPHQMGMPPGGPPYSMAPQYPGPYGPPAGAGPPQHHYMYPAYGAPPYAYQRQDIDMRPQNPRPREGPAGANLFVYHLPHDLTDADLATAFNPFGNVISAKVYVDKYTGESKGFGFVSYDSVISAESAIEQMNGFQIGNKRLKVQHKRVTPNQHPGMQSHPFHHPQQQHHGPPPPQQQHHHPAGNGYGVPPP